MVGHFPRSVLVCPTMGGVRLETGFGEALERLRVELQVPLYITNAFRSPDHNTKVDGYPRSRHLVIN